jgi:hypothetical protein
MFLVAGKAANKEGAPEEKKDDGELWCNVEAQAAFLGPNLWDKTLPYDADLKVRIQSLMRFVCRKVALQFRITCTRFIQVRSLRCDTVHFPSCLFTADTAELILLLIPHL